LVVFIAASSAGCPSGRDPAVASPSPAPAAKGGINPLATTKTATDFADNPRLLSRLLSGPHGYFRFVSRQFSTEVCSRFATETAQMPSVNLHGDAHVEQYAVTDLGRGLTDFDDASRGPAIIDLVRFGVSLSLAAEANGWSRHTPEFIAAFLGGYQDALRNPGHKAPIPTVVGRFLSSFRADRSAALEAARELMEPLNFPLIEAQKALDAYAVPLLETDKALTPNFFRAKTAGHLRIGIGSGLDEKYLVIVEGLSEGSEDDVVLEAKEVRNLASVPCLATENKSDPFRILVGSARIAYQPFRYLGYTAWKGKTFWVHAWTDNYYQVAADRGFASPGEIKELAYDVGVQLGRGHPYLVASPLDAQLRLTLVRHLEMHRKKLLAEIAELTVLTREAWTRFAGTVTGQKLP